MNYDLVAGIKFCFLWSTTIMKCIACGSAALIKGGLAAESGIGFQPDDVSYLKQIFGVGARKIHAYACIHCGNMQLTVDFKDNDRARYQQFEGEQPNLLDRINPETK